MDWILALNIVTALIWVGATYQYIGVMKQIYGGRFTTALPYFAGFYGVLTLVVVLHVIYKSIVVSSAGYPMTLISVLNTGYVVAGILLTKGFYEVYNMNFGVHGFEEVLDGE